jgi:hypothetical protein
VVNTAWCGRRDGGMIFNPNDCEVAPPHTRGVSAVQAKGVCANTKYREVTKEGISVKS